MQKYYALRHDNNILIDFLKVIFEEGIEEEGAPARSKAPLIEAEELAELRTKYTNTQIAHIKGINVKSVEFYVRKYGLQRKK